MKKFLLLSLLFILSPIVARAATCDAGYYDNDGVCTQCTNGYYCPGDGTRVACPPNTLTPQEISEHTGADLQSSTVGTYVSSHAHNNFPSSQDDCYINFIRGHIEGEKCLFYQVAFHYDTSSQTYVPHHGDSRLYREGVVGGYLSDYVSGGYYKTCNQCTNAPASAHYTGPGTPDVGNCPWECDDGYYGSSENGDTTCTLCPAGYACTGGVMTNCADVTGANGRPTYANAGASVCTECPAVTGEYATRVDYYGLWAGSVGAPHTQIEQCLVYFKSSDPDSTSVQWCYYRNGYYTSSSSPCYFRAPTWCAVGKYATITNAPEWYGGNTGAATCLGVDCMNGKICTAVDAGYYSPDGDTEQHACTTPPTNAHITTACTPGANSAWECNADTVHMSNDTCEPLCRAGVTQLHTSTGLVFNLYANKLTSPAVHIKTDTGAVCYVNLATGTTTGAVHFRVGDTVYHTTN